MGRGNQRLERKYGCEPPLGFVKTTKPVIIQAGTSREIHGLTNNKTWWLCCELYQ